VFIYLMSQPVYFDTAVECLVAILGQQDGSRFPNILGDMIVGVASLQDLFTQFYRVRNSKHISPQQSADEDACRSLCRVFLAPMEAHLHVLLRATFPAHVQAVLVRMHIFLLVREVLDCH
jgi:hypothetical protein